MLAIAGHGLLCDRLDDEVDMARRDMAVRPQAHVDLVGLEEFGDRRSSAVQERTQLGALFVAEFRHAKDMPDGLDHKRPDPQRANAVFHNPMGSLVDATAGERLGASEQVAGKARRFAARGVRQGMLLRRGGATSVETILREAAEVRPVPPVRTP